MSAPLQIRRASEHDVETIAQFNEAMALETERKVLNPDTIRAGVRAVLESDQHGFYLIAQSDGEIAGGLLITYEWSDWRNGQFWWIQSVYVPSAFRRRGVYRQLYQHVQDLAEQADNICGIRLYVEKENHVAQQVYADLGMHETAYQMFEWER